MLLPMEFHHQLPFCAVNDDSRPQCQVFEIVRQLFKTSASI